MQSYFWNVGRDCKADSGEILGIIDRDGVKLNGYNGI